MTAASGSSSNVPETIPMQVHNARRRWRLVACRVAGEAFIWCQAGLDMALLPALLARSVIACSL
jgi:hypothetical protein